MIRRGRGPSGDMAGVAILLVAGVAGYVVFPDDLALLNRIAATGLLVLSLDLLIGLCGVVTLGQAALFGAGAYAAAVAAVGGIAEPFALLAVGAAAGGLAGLLAGAVILRAAGLPQLVLSIAIAGFLHEAANKAAWLTGGSDGLSEPPPAPLFGLLDFDLRGRTAYLLSLGVLVGVFALLRAIAAAPFGLLCRGIKADAVRIRAMGAAPYPALLKMYVISGAVAGLAGALSAITTGVVGLDSLGFERSAEALVMLALGGAGNLYGAIIGTAAFMLFQDVVSVADPFHWLTLVGALLIGIALAAPHGLTGAVRPLLARARPPW